MTTRDKVNVARQELRAFLLKERKKPDWFRVIGVGVWPSKKFFISVSVFYQPPPGQIPDVWRGFRVCIEIDNSPVSMFSEQGRRIIKRRNTKETQAPSKPHLRIV